MSLATVIFRGKSLSKNKLTCKNAVARIYGSCTLRVMGYGLLVLINGF